MEFWQAFKTMTVEEQPSNVSGQVKVKDLVGGNKVLVVPLKKTNLRNVESFRTFWIFITTTFTGNRWSPVGEPSFFTAPSWTQGEAVPSELW